MAKAKQGVTVYESDRRLTESHSNRRQLILGPTALAVKSQGISIRLVRDKSDCAEAVLPLHLNPIVEWQHEGGAGVTVSNLPLFDYGPTTSTTSGVRKMRARDTDGGHRQARYIVWGNTVHLREISKHIDPL